MIFISVITRSNHEAAINCLLNTYLKTVILKTDLFIVFDLFKNLTVPYFSCQLSSNLFVILYKFIKILWSFLLQALSSSKFVTFPIVNHP
jgi:hypothetical protein